MGINHLLNEMILQVGSMFHIFAYIKGLHFLINVGKYTIRPMDPKGMIYHHFLLFMWPCSWFRNPARKPPGMVLKACK